MSARDCEVARPAAIADHEVVQAEVVGKAIVATAAGGIGDRDRAVALGDGQPLIAAGERDLEIAPGAIVALPKTAEAGVDLRRERGLVGSGPDIDLERQDSCCRRSVDHRERRRAASGRRRRNR